MRKKAMTDNGPEGRGQGVTLDPVKAPIVSPNNLRKIIEPKGIPGGAGRGKERERHRPYASLRKRTTIQFGSSYDIFHIPRSLQRLSELNFLLSLLLQT